MSAQTSPVSNAGPEYRLEHDFLGTLEVPIGALFGIQTRRAAANSAVGNARLVDRPSLLSALATVKAACAEANRQVGVLPEDIAHAVAAAASEVASGGLREHFPLEVVQGGGGTALNMNVNEVLANRANQLLGADVGGYRPVHPIDHVNRSQSTNDVFPTAMCIATRDDFRVADQALRAVIEIIRSLAADNRGLDRLGRSCLQDAVSVPVSNLHRTHAFALERAREDLAQAVDRLLAVPLGGTAVGTGLGAPRGYRESALGRLRTLTGLDLATTDDLGDGLASLEVFGAVSDAIARAGRVLHRVAGDLRLLASGPVGGFGEVSLPALQSGSSIMPGKVNPVLSELVMQVYFQLAGSAHVVGVACASVELDVTPMGPVVIDEVLGSLGRLTRVARLFVDRCLIGLRWNTERVTANLSGSFDGAVREVVVDGYDSVAHRRYQQPGRTERPGGGGPDED